MRILVAEDDMVSRKYLLRFLSNYGDCDLTVNGIETLEAFLLAIRENKPYDLICLDIMMPKVDGIKVLKTIRQLEREEGILPEDRVKVIMVTALDETDYIWQAFDIGCEAYAAKPIDTEKLIQVMKKLGLLEKAV